MDVGRQKARHRGGVGDTNQPSRTVRTPCFREAVRRTHKSCRGTLATSRQRASLQLRIHFMTTWFSSSYLLCCTCICHGVCPAQQYQRAGFDVEDFCHPRCVRRVLDRIQLQVSPKIQIANLARHDSNLVVIIDLS